MTLLIAGLLIFFIMHIYTSLRSRAPDRDIKERMGHGPYMGLYSLISLAGLVLIVYGYGQARPAQVLYAAPTWGKHVTYPLMLAALVALMASQIPAGYIKKVLKHPMLVAVKLWAVGHLFANGDLASILLFGTFLAYAVFSRIMAKRRGDVGPGPDAVLNPWMDVTAIVVGLGLFVLIGIYLHPILFGVVAIG